MSKHLILSVSPYDFESKKGETVERVVGAKISYINRKPSSRDNEDGFTPFIVNVNNMDLVDEIGQVPGLYEMDFEQVIGKNNKPQIILTDIELIKPIDLTQIMEG